MTSVINDRTDIAAPSMRVRRFGIALSFIVAGSLMFAIGCGRSSDADPRDASHVENTEIALREVVSLSLLSLSRASEDNWVGADHQLEKANEKLYAASTEVSQLRGEGTKSSLSQLVDLQQENVTELQRFIRACREPNPAGLVAVAESRSDIYHRQKEALDEGAASYFSDREEMEAVLLSVFGE